MSLAVGGLLLAWLAGFFWFVAKSPRTADDAAAASDAIVVLTGGSGRLEEGLKLLREGKGRTLFVSGVAPGVGLDELLRSAGKSAPAWAICCVVLGHEARNTHGNAQETARWIKSEGYRSLRLVTAWYHMPRSLLEFERAMPRMTIVPHPVFPAELDRCFWWKSERGTVLLAGEYSKYLLTLGEALLLREEPVRSWPHSGRASGEERR